MIRAVLQQIMMSQTNLTAFMYVIIIANWTKSDMHTKL